MKRLNDYRVNTDYICQVKSDGEYNAIDCNFLTTNSAVQRYLTTGKKPLRNDYLMKFSKLGSFVRCPWNLLKDNESKHWDNPKTVSRDNSFGCMMSNHLLCGDYGINENRMFAIKILKRFSFFQNTHNVKMEKKFIPDWCGPDSWAVLLRSCLKPGELRIIKPVLALLDCFYLLNVLTFLVHCFFKRDYNSPLFHMVTSVYYMCHVRPTMISKLNKWLLLTFTPVNKKYSSKGKYDGILSQLKEYSRSSYDPPIYLVTEQLLAREL